MTAMLRAAWGAWKTFAFWLGDKQATLIYALIYFVIVGPIALIRRPFTDPLQWRARNHGSYWLPRVVAEPTLDDATRQ
jgi:hypothetical protein